MMTFRDVMRRENIVAFPLLPDMKIPYKGEDWKTNRITTPEMVDGMEQTPKFSGCNWGVNCGASGLIVVDLDVKQGIDGVANWVDLATMNGGVEDTLSVRTPTGGWHLYFRGDGSNSAGKLAGGIDIRGDGGYVVSPGSRVNGVEYVVANDRPIAPAPPWLTTLVHRSRAVKVDIDDSFLNAPSVLAFAKTWLSEDAEPAVEGASGDAQTLSVAMQLRDYGLTEQAALDLMVAYYNPRCIPEWDYHALLKKVNNAYLYAQNTIGACSALGLASAKIESYKAPTQEPDTVVKAVRVRKFADAVRAGAAQGAPVPLLGDYLYESDLAILFASTNVGKSLLAMQWAIDVAKGNPTLTLAGTPNAKRVLYCDYELSDRQLASRYNASAMPDTLYRLDLNPESLEFMNGMRLATAIDAAITEVDADIVVVDNVTYLSDDTTDAAEAIKLMKMLKFIKMKRGVTMLVIAHTPKRKETKPVLLADLSGSANLANFADSIFALGRSVVDNNMRYIKHLKTRVCEIKQTVLSAQIMRDEHHNLVFIPRGDVYEEEMLKGKQAAGSAPMGDIRADVMKTLIASALQVDKGISYDDVPKQAVSQFRELFGSAKEAEAFISPMTEGAVYQSGDTMFELVNHLGEFRDAIPDWRERKFYRSSRFFRQVMF